MTPPAPAQPQLGPVVEQRQGVTPQLNINFRNFGGRSSIAFLNFFGNSQQRQPRRWFYGKNVGLICGRLVGTHVGLIVLKMLEYDLVASGGIGVGHHSSGTALRNQLRILSRCSGTLNISYSPSSRRGINLGEMLSRCCQCSASNAWSSNFAACAIIKTRRIGALG